MYKNSQIKTMDSYFPVWDLLDALPGDFPLCLLTGGERFSILAAAFEEISKEEILGATLGKATQKFNPEIPFMTGYIGIISYDDYFLQKSGISSRFFKIYSALIFDRKNKTVHLTGDPCHSNAAYKIPEQLLENHDKRAGRPFSEGIELIPAIPDGKYLRTVEKILDDIRKGRYYQLNYLRYFTCFEYIDCFSICSRLRNNGGPQSAWIRLPDLEIISFSPERFVETYPENGRLKIMTYPIKGTSSRKDDPVLDRLEYEKLQMSGKDQSELHMIVDLMRNDLHRICMPHSVEVIDGGKAHSFKKVHHLIAKISGILRDNLTFRDFLNCLCPAGSITGAPKIEVMKAIREYEGRSRGWFMGNAFYWDISTGRFDSSVLIRTMVRTGQSSFEYAAGGGIVIKSRPLLELEEINAKCRVLTDPLDADSYTEI
ncbi:MAG: chorismate-binding protein [Oligoflexales bacterium]|nr:chorismate-binding protein [Oligoflexales bacterium]